jgi:hypothetical protein
LKHAERHRERCDRTNAAQDEGVLLWQIKLI